MNLPDLLRRAWHLAGDLMTGEDLNPALSSVILEEFIGSRESLQTRRSYRSVLVRLFQFLEVKQGTLHDLMEIPLPALTRKIRTFLTQYLKRDPETGKPQNPGTYNNRKCILSAFFKYLVLQYEYPKNIIELIPRLQGRTLCKTTSLRNVETEAMLHFFRRKAMLSKAGEENPTWVRNYLMVYGLYLMALRRSELVNIRWADINLTERSLTVRLKGNREKILPIPEAYLKLVLWYRAQFTSDSVFLFPPFQNNRMGNVNKPVSANYLYDVVCQAAMAVVQQKAVSPHSFRATFVTRALERGDDLIIIANATGHASLNMVRRYDRRDGFTHNSINNNDVGVGVLFE